MGGWAQAALAHFGLRSCAIRGGKPTREPVALQCNRLGCRRQLVRRRGRSKSEFCVSRLQ